MVSAWPKGHCDIFIKNLTHTLQRAHSSYVEKRGRNEVLSLVYKEYK